MAIIRVSGHPGSGKTVLCKRLAEALGYEEHYTGGIFKKLAEEQGLSEAELYKSTPQWFELKVDSAQASLMRENDNLVVQGRIAPFQGHNPGFKAVNILLKVSDEKGARRQLNRPSNKHLSFEEMLDQSRRRVEEERKHYKAIYGIKDHFGDKDFQGPTIVLDTTHLTPDQVFEQVLEKIKQLI